MNVAASPQIYSQSDLNLLTALAEAESRECFYSYRQYMRPKMMLGWFQRLVAAGLQEFWDDYLAGERPILIICSPPQHGKSEQVTDFVSWYSGLAPNTKTIFGSYSDTLGIRSNRELQRAFDSPKYQGIFDTRINTENVVTLSDKPRRNQSLIEFAGADIEGYFRNTTVEGSVTGESLDIGIVDDPIKGAKEARSEIKRNSVWSWTTDDFMSRFSDLAGMIMILTRWHLDDPAGRLLEEYPNAKILSFPALADAGAELMDCDPRKPGSGDPLFPELKSKEFLMMRKQLYTKQSFSSIYQQTPVVYGGGMFEQDKFGYLDNAPSPGEISHSVRYWDKAGTADGGCFTAGVLMHRLKDGRCCVEDVQRGQWSALDREKRIKTTAEADGTSVDQWVEQEPGSGGKESAESTIRTLIGFRAYADKVSGSKELRAEPYAAQQQGGNILLVRGPWNRSFINEHCEFPNGKFLDQVDSAAGSFAKITDKSKVSIKDFHAFGEQTEPDF